MPRPAPLSRSPVAALLWLAAASSAAVWLVYVTAVETARGRRLDDAAQGTLAEGSRAFEETNDLLDTISTSSLALLGAAIMAIAILRGRFRLAVGAGVLVLGANLTTQYLKATLDRPGAFGPEPGSYPSGHVTVAMSLALALVLVVPPALRAAAGLVGGAYAIGVGVAVIALDWHRPSDVVGAYLVTVAWTCVVMAALASPLGGGELRRSGRPAGRAAGVGGALAAALAVGFGAVAAIAAAGRLDLLQVADDKTAFAAASVVCALAGAVLVAAVAALVQRASSPPGAAAR